MARYSFERINIWLLLSPFLIFYVIIIILIAPEEITGDQTRYFDSAFHFVNGTFDQMDLNTALMQGPGYPLVVSIFIFLKLPILFIRLLNGFFLYLALIFTFNTISGFTSKKNALIFTAILGLYYPIFQSLLVIQTEALAWLMISVVCYLFMKAMKNNEFSWKYILLLSLSIAYLAMTKVIFGYVILCSLILAILWWFINRNRVFAIKLVFTFLFSFLFCLPWLYHTYQKTNKIFYWSTAGSSNLYCMSTPFNNEFGDWKSDGALLRNPNHTDFMKKISKLEFLERDEALREKAIQNITEFPAKYFKNWIANVGRLLFSYPKSYKMQDLNLYYTMVPTMFAVVFIVLSIIVGLYKYKFIPKEIVFLFLFTLIYLSGSSLVSAQRRMFYITIPFWTIFISYVFTNILSIKIKKE